jgi:hypothetical protein
VTVGPVVLNHYVELLNSPAAPRTTIVELAHDPKLRKGEEKSTVHRLMVVTELQNCDPWLFFTALLMTQSSSSPFIATSDESSDSREK